MRLFSSRCLGIAWQEMRETTVGWVVVGVLLVIFMIYWSLHELYRTYIKPYLPAPTPPEIELDVHHRTTLARQISEATTSSQDVSQVQGSPLFTNPFEAVSRQLIVICALVEIVEQKDPKNRLSIPEICVLCPSSGAGPSIQT